jgi:hypothetical protein
MKIKTGDMPRARRFFIQRWLKGEKKSAVKGGEAKEKKGPSRY